MIITLTLNPSIDRAFELKDLRFGEVNRGVEGRVDAGGKGINISRALHAHGTPTRAVFPCGGASGKLLVGLLESLGVSCDAVEITEETRTNITLSSGDSNDSQGQVTTKINADGPSLSTADLRNLTAKLVSHVEQGAVVVASGSLPPGVPQDIYLGLAREVKSRAGSFVLDTSGDALAAVLDSADLSSVSLIKPNLEELTQVSNKSLRTFGDVVDVVESYRARGLEAALVTLGSAGALLIDSCGTFYARGPHIVPRSTVGAGDMALAGFLQCVGESEAKLSAAVAWGSAATQQQGTAVPAPSLVDYAGIRVVRNPPLHEILPEC